MFWMSRYIERAENIARFIDVNVLLTMELGYTVGEQWGPLVATTGDEAIFQASYGEPTRANVMRFLTFDERYPNSIISCLSAARENARIVREHISTAMWEQLNKFYLMVHDRAKHDVNFDAEGDFYEDVRAGAQLFVGIMDGTFSHGEGWHFAKLGRLLERADKTSRILAPAAGYGRGHAARHRAVVRTAAFCERAQHVPRAARPHSAEQDR
jgi:uncharacterized alpha-E superfamily protein